MPLYEYQCDACGHRFEVIQKYSDPPVGACPTCGGAVSKLFSSPAIQFKGSGFYLTDYGRGGGSDMGAGKGAGGEQPSGEKGGGEKTGGEKGGGKAESTSGGAAGSGEAKSEKKADPKPSGPPPTSGSGS